MIYLQDLSLTNYRCYKKRHFDFMPGINIIVGPNAIGKTSIVEAIHCLGFLRSHKAAQDEEMIRTGQEYAFVNGNFIRDDKKVEISLALTHKGKRIQSNGKAFRQLSEYLGFLEVVIFCPEDMSIVKGGPNLRRRFLDINLALTDTKYFQSMSKYRRLLKQRNEILKEMNRNGKYDMALLKIVTESMAQEAEAIVRFRNAFIAELNPLIEQKSMQISKGRESATLVYFPNCSDEIVEKMLKSIKIDIQAKTTTLGPHRDDFRIDLNGVAAAAFASQGQQRTSALALKLALAEYLKRRNEEIIILLDDVFSELDKERQNELLKLINSDYQIFITTTAIDNLSAEILEKSKIINIGREV
ncbi:MAG: DNA replication/repair protein RecF [Acholeplasmataceae bacterium]|jgi:DNA replication and repair protein RecF|nr:DNA replication/repair protein RecF [Acholeplasmataceae bacterium]